MKHILILFIIGLFLISIVSARSEVNPNGRSKLWNQPAETNTSVVDPTKESERIENNQMISEMMGEETPSVQIDNNVSIEPITIEDLKENWDIVLFTIVVIITILFLAWVLWARTTGGRL